MQYVRKPSITFQSSLYWSATDAPAVNPTQALSHFCSLMGENEKRDTEKCRRIVFTYENSSPAQASGQMHLPLQNSYHTQYWTSYSMGYLLVWGSY